MLEKSGTNRFRTFSLLAFFFLFVVSCAADEPRPTPTAIADQRPTAVSSLTPTPGDTPQATLPLAAPADTAVPTETATATGTASPTLTAVPTQTPFPLPIDPMPPFPTVTPDYFVYETKPVFLSYGGYGGDGGSVTDAYYGRFTPTLIIYGDGQFLISEGTYRESLTFLEATLTPAEMCTLRQQIEATGFTQPHDKFFTRRALGAGAGELGIQVEDTFYLFYGPEVQYLVEDLASGVELIRNYRPEKPLVPYAPTFLKLWIEEVTPDEQMTPLVWPAELPRLEDLWSDRDQNVVLVEGEWVEPIFDLFSYQLTQKFFQEGNATYAIIARPLLPHETPRHIGYYPSLPRDYVPVLNCEGQPSLISPAVPTATPTLTAPATSLTGQGRIAFVAGSYSEQEIYVIDADGTNRLRLTNNLFPDSQPAWSPDGRQIAFVSERNENLDIYVMNRDGTNVVQLTDHEYDDYSPTWSPDGTKIAFISDRDGGWRESEIYVMNADGSSEERLTQNKTRDLQPVWSPDGRKITFVKELVFSESSTLAVLYLDQPEPVEAQMSFTTRYIPRPAWSADSKKIALAVAPNLEESSIRMINLDGTETQSFSVLPLELPTSLNWSADGNYIVFAAREPNDGENAIHFSEGRIYSGNRGIYALDMTTEELIQITFTEQDDLLPALWP